MTKLADNYIESVDLSSTSYFPPIADQGAAKSCTAFAIGYYQFTYEVNKLLNRSANSLDNIYTPAWIYNTCTFEDSGIYFSQAYEFLKLHGNLTMSQMPYTSGDTTSLPSNEEAMIDALGIRAGNCYFLSLDMYSRIVSNPNDSDLDGIKALLNSGKVLVVSVSWDGREYYDGDDSNEKIVTRFCILDSQKEDEDDRGFHAMTIVGYDDSFSVDINNDGVIESSERGAFKLANSHGTNSIHDNNGFIWVMYDALNKESQISTEWESSVDGKRYSAFSGGENNYNKVYAMYVEEKEVFLVGKFSGNLKGTSNLWLSFYKSDYYINTNAYPEQLSCEYVTEYRVRGDNESEIGNLNHEYNPCILIYDFGENVINDTWELNNLDFFESYWYMKTSNRAFSDYFTQVGFILKDNLGNEIRNTTPTSVGPSNNLYSYIKLDCVMGDVNYDKSITSSDALMVLKYASKNIEFSNIQELLGDYDSNGIINAEDANLILQYSAGL